MVAIVAITVDGHSFTLYRQGPFLTRRGAVRHAKDVIVALEEDDAGR